MVSWAMHRFLPNPPLVPWLKKENLFFLFLLCSAIPMCEWPRPWEQVIDLSEAWKGLLSPWRGTTQPLLVALSRKEDYGQWGWPCQRVLQKRVGLQLQLFTTETKLQLFLRRILMALTISDVPRQSQWYYLPKPPAGRWGTRWGNTGYYGPGLLTKGPRELSALGAWPRGAKESDSEHLSLRNNLFCPGSLLFSTGSQWTPSETSDLVHPSHSTDEGMGICL